MPSATLATPSELARFVDMLGTVEGDGTAFNQYAPGDQANEIRRHNLALYLEQMAHLNPHELLVGEAAGYRGCRLTGIPFTSEAIVTGGIQGLELFGRHRGYRKTTEFAETRGEASATIVWRALEKARAVPLLWNAFPLHPHKSGNAWSNRTPVRTELETGWIFLARLLDLYDIRTVIAVGRQATIALTGMNVPHHQVRHPAHGGAAMFATRVLELLKH